MYKIKSFFAKNFIDLENKVNDWLCDHSDITITQVIQNDGETWTMFTILYKERGI